MRSRSGKNGLMLLGVAGVLAALLALAVLSSSAAHAAETSDTVPTTRILAIGTLTPKAKADPASVRSILPEEVRETVELYLAGKLDQWFAKQDQTGVVFILNETDPVAAKQMLEKLPLGQAGLMTFELTPMGPLRPLGVLVRKPAP